MRARLRGPPSPGTSWLSVNNGAWLAAAAHTKADPTPRSKRDRTQRHCPASHGTRGQPAGTEFSPVTRADQTRRVHWGSGLVSCPVCNAASGRSAPRWAEKGSVSSRRAPPSTWQDERLSHTFPATKTGLRAGSLSDTLPLSIGGVE